MRRLAPLRFREDKQTGASIRLGDGDRWRRIRCPLCRWQPGRHDRWMCSCQHSWNTFDTRGVCPACGYVWTDTMCIRCAKWSPHADWYEGDG